MDNGKDAKFELDQFNLDTNDVSWDYSPERDTRTLGGVAISASESDPLSAEIYQKTIESIPDFAPAPPAFEQPSSSENTATKNSPQTDITAPKSTVNDLKDLHLLREDNNRISETTVNAVERTVSDFEKGKITPAELADLKWEATKAYLKNSFGREIS
ncbi:hypothetical protein IJG28_01565 [Candidatus Saccharibacteria bacterium]|nr:hypothetical protein [Candidatus Saccharibacteria bacterium]